MATGEAKPDAKPADGSFQAMDQIANWVRFADTKATILIAGLGVALTMLMTSANTVVTAINKGDGYAITVYTLLAITVTAFLWTLGWLLAAITPRRTTTLPGVNRFAWPTLRGVDREALLDRGVERDVREDAWQQVVDLSEVARLKFAATGKAVCGFGVVIACGGDC